MFFQKGPTVSLNTFDTLDFLEEMNLVFRGDREIILPLCNLKVSTVPDATVGIMNKSCHKENVFVYITKWSEILQDCQCIRYVIMKTVA